MAKQLTDKIELVARQLRIRLSIDDQIRPDMTTVIVKLKDAGLIKNYVRVPDEEMPDDEAYYDPSDRILYLRESTFCAASAAWRYTKSERRRARFTIAHEIGHVVLGHTANIRFRGTTAEVAEKLVPRIRKEEGDANRFAAAFLVPAHLAGV